MSRCSGKLDELTAPGLPWVSGKRPGDRGEIEELELLSALDGTPEVMGRHDGREV